MPSAPRLTRREVRSDGVKPTWPKPSGDAIRAMRTFVESQNE